MTKFSLVYDIGTTGTKASLFDKHQIVQTVTVTYDTQFGDDGLVEQNAEDWWQAIISTTQQLDHRQQVDRIIVTGQMQNVILLDTSAKPVRPVILYSDTRADAESKQVLETIGAETLQSITGNNIDAGSLLSKLLWLAHHEPQSLDSASNLVFGSADFVAGKMTGTYVTDSTTASTTGLLNIQNRQIIDDDIFQRLNLAQVTGLMPEVVAGGSQIGQLSPDMAQQLGLNSDISVFLAPGDAGSATIGAGSGEIGTAYAYIGTSGWVALTTDIKADPDQGVITLIHPKDEHYIQVAPMMMAGGNLDWIRELFQETSYDELITLGVHQPVSKLVYLPYLNGERSPFSDPYARGVFIGLNAHTTKADVYRAVLEGVIFAYRHILDAFAPIQIKLLTLSGGGARSAEWNQLFADILNLPVQIISDPENVGGRGAIHAVDALAHTASSYRLDDLPILSEFSPTTDAELLALYQQKYRWFRESYGALAPIFESLATS